MNKLSTLLGGLGLGAGMMYFYDPHRGRRRRTLVRDQFTRMITSSGNLIEEANVDIRNRTRGVLADAMALVSQEEVTDWVINERVRAVLGRVATHPRSLDVNTFEGIVTLRGPILSQDVDRVVGYISKVRGVKGIDNQLEVHEQAGDHPQLQGGSQREPQFELLQENWSPAARLVTGVAGGVLALYGLTRKGIIGSTVGLAGMALAARGVMNLELRRILGTSTQRNTIQVQKAINIEATAEELYNFWSRYENFPKVMAHVREVKDLGNGRSYWMVHGPAGTPVEWDAQLTHQIPNQLIAWESLPGEAIQNRGRVRFDSNDDGSTRVTVRMSYTPPAGAMGHAVAKLMGIDPKHQMDEDLVRLKSLFEKGKVRAEGHSVTRDELLGSMGAD